MQPKDPLYISRDRRVHISARAILQQVKFDLFSKGVQTGYTTSYSWLADQFGHLGLGFIGVIALYAGDAVLHIAGWKKSQLAVQFRPGLILTVVFALLEIYDYWQAAKDAAKAGTFPFRKMDVARDAATAVWFFLFGAVLAQLLLAHPLGGDRRVGWLALAMLLVSLLVAGFWLRRKMCFQRAQLPVVFRLANFRAPELSEGGSVPLIVNFTKLSGAERHLLITGPLQSGKTTIGCAIGTETTFRLSPARYFTLTAFRESFNAKKDPQSTTRNRLWAWNESNIIILDDLILELLPQIEAATKAMGTTWKDRLGDRRVAWLLADVNAVDTWVEQLHRIFDVYPTVVRLAPPPPGGYPERSAKVVAKGFR